MRREAKALAEELAAVETALAPLVKRQAELREQLRKKLPLETKEDLFGFHFTVYSKDNTSFDATGFLATLDEERLGQITTRQLDKTKLDSALKLGLIRPEEAEPFIHVGAPTKVLAVRPLKDANGKDGAGE